MAISPTDGTIFTAGQDGTVRQWDPRSGRELGVFASFAELVQAMAFAPDGKALFLSGGPTIGLALWSVAERREIRRLSRIHENTDARYVGFFPRDGLLPDGKEMIEVEAERGSHHGMPRINKENTLGCAVQYRHS